VRRCRGVQPQLEHLEDRLQPGETFGLGWAALGLAELPAVAGEAPFGLECTDHDRPLRHGAVAGGEASGQARVVAFGEEFGSLERPAVDRHVLEAAPIPESAARSSALAGVAGDELMWQAALPPVPATPAFPGLLAASTGSPVVNGLLVSSAGAPAALVQAGQELPNADTAPAQFGVLATPVPNLAPGQLRFDAATGQVAIPGPEWESTVHAAVTPDGFLDVTLDGQHHSSNPRAAAFDPALAGATNITLAGIRFDGRESATLLLDAASVPGSLTVQANGAAVNTHDVTVAGSLVIQAPQITVSGALRGATIALASSGWIDVQAAGRIDARQGAFGGRIELVADKVANAGQLHADGRSGGHIVVQAGNILNSGPVTAEGTGPGGTGGQVQIAFTGAYVDTTGAVTSASSVAGLGGQLTLDGGRSGRLYSSGHHGATGSVGGALALLGREVVLAGATVNASGVAGGGSVRVGGDFHGANPAVVNADTVTVTPASTIQADAGQTGAGGRVAIWADQTTAFAGAVSARGGTASGAGGFIEVSGRGSLSYGGAADAGALAGKGGTLLLDPKNLVISAAPVGVYPQFNLMDPHPTAGGGFGRGIRVLSTGNVVVSSPYDDFGGSAAGAVYLFDGSSGALLRALVGSHPNDQVGSERGFLTLTVLGNGNYVLSSVFWNGNRGAVTWGDGRSGVGGPVSEANSLVGSQPNDQVNAAIVLSNNNYLVDSPLWNGNRGAVTWGDGRIGVRGLISEANSLVGSEPNDGVGFPDVTLLSNGNYVVVSPNWNGGFVNGHGAATWGDGSTGVRGVISAANSLVGANPGDHVGSVTPLSNGNYVVFTLSWNGNRGAVTWGDGNTGVRGPVSEANSLVGSQPNDRVGCTSVLGDSCFGSIGLSPLSNGNYVVLSALWNGNRGAVTWGDGRTGVRGPVSEANSLVGSQPNDRVGYFGRAISLSNGNYVVLSSDWNGMRGAATWGDASTGVRGPVSEANSLVGSRPNDLVGTSVTRLSNGNYVVGSNIWNGGRGAVTWGSGRTGVRGVVSEADSLVGTDPWDSVGDYGVTLLSNGNYVVSSPYWNGSRGAATWGDASTGVRGPVSAANSLVGSQPDDRVSYPYGFAHNGIVPLSNGNYVVRSSDWNGGRGAATWGDGSAGVRGPVSAANSLVGSQPNDGVGLDGYGLAVLSNGNYVVQSSSWNGRRGAVTWGDGSVGVRGPVSEDNSLVGSQPNDSVGFGNYGVSPLINGNYVVRSGYWNGRRGAVTWGNGRTGVHGPVSEANSVVGDDPGDLVGSSLFYNVLSNGNYLVVTPYWDSFRGAVTFVDGTTGQSLDGQGVITPQNSVVGGTALAGLRDTTVVLDPAQQWFLAPFPTEGSGRITVGLLDPNQLSYTRGQAQTMTVTPAFLTATLNTGTAVVLQASNDLTVDDPITVHASGHGGALTLQAGRSLLLNANITTDNGALTLIANDTRANGVVDDQRDPGNAVLTMTPGTTLDTGTGALRVTLRDGSGLSHRDSGAITLQTVHAGSIVVVNYGPSANSDVLLGPVTTSGPQSYANPNGQTEVDGSLRTSDQPITFADAVAVDDAIGIRAGTSTIDFAGRGLQTLFSGPVATLGHVRHTGSGTLQLTSDLAVFGSFGNTAGLFDANNHVVTVEEQASVTGGTYRAGADGQVFVGGVTVTQGVFTGSTDPLTVSGPITLSGGRFAGVGRIDSLTASGSTVTLGTPVPGILYVAADVTLDATSTLRIPLQGLEAGSGYAQLRTGGPIVLGGSTLQLDFGFTPPVGSRFELVATSDLGPIHGTFAGLAEGAVFDQNGWQLQITYQGGTGGNSVVVTRLA
jgi:hypothetical protein